MALAFRVTGWAVFASGLAVFILNGGVSNVRDPWSIAALVLMPVGMLLTGASTVLAWRAGLRRVEQEMKRPPVPGIPAPDPSKPEKHYGARPLDAGKLKKPDPTPPAGPP